MTRLSAVIVGSGPSGVAVAQALIEAGIRPTIIDGGIDVSAAAHSQRNDVLSGGERNGAAAEKNDSPGAKSWFGSTSPYTQPAESDLRYTGVSARVSFGRGGFSRVWGATNVPFAGYRNWPTDSVPRAQDFLTSGRIMPSSLTAFNWTRSELAPGEILGSARSAAAKRRVDRHLRHGWTTEPSKIAMTSQAPGSSICRACDACLSGCPVDAIWSATEVVDRWINGGAIDYRPGLIVSTIEETTEFVRVRARDANGGEVLLNAERVYIGAGPLGSAAIAIRSGFFDRLEIRDTSTAFLGAIAARLPERENVEHHPLSQWWIRSGDSGFLAQVYPPTGEHTARIQEMLPGGRFLGGPARFAAGLTHPIIAYLRPDKCDPLIAARRGQIIEFTGTTSPETQANFKAYLQKFASIMMRSGYVVPPLTTQFTAPGAGFHSGSSLPHGEKTDELGRLPGHRRIHFVDASVLPNIEVGSITPTVMANAARIARTSVAP